MTEALCSWGRQRGVFLHNSIELRNDGVFARNDIPAEETLIFVPWSVCMDPVGFTTASVDANTPLCAFLLDERDKGPTSDWFPYIAVLPETFSTAMSLPKAEINYLRGTNLYHEIERRTAMWEQEAKGLDRYSFDYAWAAQVVSSRSFPSSLRHTAGASPILIPFADAFNHRPLTKIEWSCTDRGFSMKIIEALSVGSEIYNNYGPKTNEELLLGYGFCLQDNPFDYVSLAIADHTFQLHLNVISEEMIDFFKAACANEYEKNHNIDGPRCELAALVAISNALKYKLATIPRPERPSPVLQQNTQIYQHSQWNIINSGIKAANTRISQILDGNFMTMDMLKEPSLFIEVQHRFPGQNLNALRLQGYEDTLLGMLLVLILRNNPGHAVLQELKERYSRPGADPEVEEGAQILSEQIDISFHDVLWSMRVVTEEAVNIDRNLVLLGRIE